MRRLVVPGRPEHLDDLGPHLATARAEARSDRGDQVLWPAPELPRQRGYRHAGNPLHRPSPSRVNGGDRRPGRIGEQNRRTIGDANRNGHVVVVRDDPVGGRRRPRTGRALVNGGDADAVHLADAGECDRGSGAASRATPAHSLSSLRSSRSPTVNRCAAYGSSGRQTRPRPHGVCVHSKPSVGLG